MGYLLSVAPLSTFISIREAAMQLGVHENTVRRCADRGLIGAVRLPSGVRRLRRVDVEALRLITPDQPQASLPAADDPECDDRRADRPVGSSAGQRAAAALAP